jgi:Uma2 family endonuclease
MSSPSTVSPGSSAAVLPPLENGDRLDREEFHRRYLAMPEDFRAELVEGVVYVASPVRFRRHGKPHASLATWIGVYVAATPGTEAAADTTVELDDQNEPQPDIVLRLLPECGGQSRATEDDYIESAPELCIEVAGSAASYDLHGKLEAYRRNGVREYLVWRTYDGKLDWFALRDGVFVPLAPDSGGILQSEAFPGLRLDAPALLRDDMSRVLAVLGQGVESAEHAAFVERLRRRRESGLE